MYLFQLLADDQSLSTNQLPPADLNYTNESQTFNKIISKIPGIFLGLQTTKAYQKDEFIIEYCGERIDCKEKEKRFKEQNKLNNNDGL